MILEPEKTKKSFCLTCNQATNQIVLKEELSNYSEPEEVYWEENRFQIIQCGGCDTISFRKLHYDIMLSQYPDAEWDEDLFPNRGKHKRIAKELFHAPQVLRTVYNETLNAFNSDLKLLTGIGIRAIIEAICLDNEIKSGKVKSPDGTERISRSLDGKIAGLATKGLLTTANAEILHELRFIGNEAAHEMLVPLIDELKLALDIIELALETIYEVKHTAIKLRRKRKNRKE